MAVTATLVTSGGLPYRVVGAQRETITKVVFDNSYESGGEPLTAAQLGLNIVESATVDITNGSENEAEFPVETGWYSASTGLIHLMNSKTSKEVASTKNVEKVEALVTARGR